MTADIRLRKALMRLSRESSVAGVKAAVALVHWDGVEVPAKVLEIINDIETQWINDIETQWISDIETQESLNSQLS